MQWVQAAFGSSRRTPAEAPPAQQELGVAEAQRAVEKLRGYYDLARASLLFIAAGLPVVRCRGGAHSRCVRRPTPAAAAAAAAAGCH